MVVWINKCYTRVFHFFLWVNLGVLKIVPKVFRGCSEVSMIFRPWLFWYICTQLVEKILTAKIKLYFHKFTFEVHDFFLIFLPRSCLPGTYNLVSWVEYQAAHTHQRPNVDWLLWEIESSVVTFEHFQPRRTAVLLMQPIMLWMRLSTSWNEKGNTYTKLLNKEIWIPGIPQGYNASGELFLLWLLFIASF